MPLSRVDGDILTGNYNVIVHIANAVSTIPKGFSSVLFATFPHADIYSRRNEADPPLRDQTGTFIACGDGREERFVVHIIASKYPGPPKWTNDALEKRKEWFVMALNDLGRYPLFQYPDTTVAFPAGLADFEPIIEEWAKRMLCQVVIVRWAGADRTAANARTLDTNSSQ